MYNQNCEGASSCGPGFWPYPALTQGAPETEPATGKKKKKRNKKPRPPRPLGPVLPQLMALFREMGELEGTALRSLDDSESASQPETPETNLNEAESCDRDAQTRSGALNRKPDLQTEVQ
jgi:hypothetical protein